MAINIFFRVNNMAWIQKAIKRAGALRKKMGAKKGKKISAAKLTSTASKLKKKSKSGTITKSESRTLKQINLAKTLKKMRAKK